MKELLQELEVKLSRVEEANRKAKVLSELMLNNYFEAELCNTMKAYSYDRVGMLNEIINDYIIIADSNTAQAVDIKNSLWAENRKEATAKAITSTQKD
jgi:hypothetical protein